MDSLAAKLKAVGKNTIAHTTADGSRLLLLPYGARILGLYSGQSDQNFYWTNPALMEPETAKEVFNPATWQNTGGDRTWITPELDIFFPDYPAAQKHWEPPQLDASEYFVQKTPSGICMGKKMTLNFARPNKDVTIELLKELRSASNPLRYERDAKPYVAKLEFAGYTQLTTLQIDQDQIQAGIWNLVQLPHKGELIIPTYSRVNPLVLFGNIPANYLISEDHCVRFKILFKGEHKIAVRAVDTCGRVGYVYQSKDKWQLVIRNFFVNPSGEYVDVPKNDPADLGYSVHSVNVDSALGDFCELEYHAPAISSSEFSDVDVSQVWAFRGDWEAIASVSKKLLGAAPEMSA
jgi:hypothetical protein